MKKSLITLLSIICVLTAYAQNQYATTSDGKRVLLKSNGTWEYATEGTKSTSALQAKGNTTSAASNISSSRKTNTPTTRTTTPTKKTTGRTYIRGPRGGCYYINSNGNKTYVDRSFCN